MNPLFDLSGQCALVTGAASGLGQGISVALAEAGADVSLVSLDESLETAEMVKRTGRKAHIIRADLHDIARAKATVDETVQTFGKVDILVNNAGIIRRTPALEFSERDWDDVMEINAKTVFFMSQAAAKDMVKRSKGKIINIASLLSFSGGINVPSYSASKGAVAQITKSLANEWARLGLNINAIAPGYMVTLNTTALRQDLAREKAITERIPAGRWGSPADLAGAAVFLASPASDYVNGHVLVVDGGWMAR